MNNVQEITPLRINKWLVALERSGREIEARCFLLDYDNHCLLSGATVTLDLMEGYLSFTCVIQSECAIAPALSEEIALLNRIYPGMKAFWTEEEQLCLQHNQHIAVGSSFRQFKEFLAEAELASSEAVRACMAQGLEIVPRRSEEKCFADAEGQGVGASVLE